MTDERMFPIQCERGAAPHPTHAELAFLRAEVERLTKERDEARASLARVTEERDEHAKARAGRCLSPDCVSPRRCRLPIGHAGDHRDPVLDDALQRAEKAEAGVATSRREIDRLREEIMVNRTAVGRANGERDHALADLARVTEERDEARAEIARLREALEAIMESGCRSVVNDLECLARQEPSHWMCPACRARAALSPEVKPS